MGTLAISWLKKMGVLPTCKKRYAQRQEGPLLLRLFRLCGYRSKRHTMPLCSLKLFCEAPPKCV